MRAEAFPPVRLSVFSIVSPPSLLSNCLSSRLPLQCGCLCSESAGWRILLEWTLTVRSERLPLRRCPVHTDSAVQAACRPLIEHQLQGAGRHDKTCTSTSNHACFSFSFNPFCIQAKRCVRRYMHAEYICAKLLLYCFVVLWRLSVLF